MGGFSDQLTAFALKAENRVDQIVREVVYQVGLSVVRLSPIKSGAFVSNWRYGLMTPDTRWNPAQLSIRFVTGMDRMPKAASKFTHTISNAAPYGPALERGHSKQAPLGMITLTKLAFEDIVANAARKAPTQ